MQAAQGEKVPEAAPVTKAKKAPKPSVRWVTAEEAKERYGRISDATLARWIEREQFPEPVLFGGRLRMWDERELDEFDARRKAARDAAKSTRRAARRMHEERKTVIEEAAQEAAQAAAQVQAQVPSPSSRRKGGKSSST